MGLGSDIDNFVKVRVVDMSIDTKETTVDVAQDAEEVSRKRVIFNREKIDVVELVLDPFHQELDVLRCGLFHRGLVLFPVFPQVFKSERRRRSGT